MRISSPSAFFSIWQSRYRASVRLAMFVPAALALGGCGQALETATPIPVATASPTVAMAQATAVDTATAVAALPREPASTATLPMPSPTSVDLPSATPMVVSTETPVKPSASPVVVSTDTPVAPSVTPVPILPSATRVSRPPTARPGVTRRPSVPPRLTSAPSVPSRTPVLPTALPPTRAPTPVVVLVPTAVPGAGYDAYIQAATKDRQSYHFSCEFDAAWVVFTTYGLNVSVDQMIGIIGLDRTIEPTFEETPKGVFIYGGDVRHFYSGDYNSNFLARTTGEAMRKVFEHFRLAVTPVHTEAAVKAALRAGSLVWIKTTADFKAGRPATWVMPDGSTYQTVLGNDHAAVVIGYNAGSVVIRDVLGPTSTNAQRNYEYTVPWNVFLSAWGQQSNDGLAVAHPGGR